MFDGRTRVHDGDFFVLRHIWNNLDQVELLEEIVNPVVDALLPRASGRAPLHRPVGVSLDDLLTELGLIRELLTSGAELSRHPAVQPAQEPQRDQGRARGAAGRRRARA